MQSAQHTEYFDFILNARQEGAPWVAALGDFNHWGYWEDPDRSRGSLDELEPSQQALTDKLLAMGHVKDGTSYLDVGCGLGGTLRTVDGAHEHMHLYGLDRDERLADLTRRNVPGSPTNTVEVRQGDATALPWDDATMDVVSAVECIFHFPSREAFLKEAHRVLKPGGRLILCDYLLHGVPEALRRRQQLLARSPALKWLGSMTFITLKDYEALCLGAGFQRMDSLDVTRNTLPTYDTRVAFFRSTGLGLKTVAPRIAGMRLAELTSRMGIFRYVLISMTKA